MNEPQEPQINVVKIADRWHARLLIGDEVRDEMACKLQCDIGWICREMLRWYDKLGGQSEFAASARRRQISCKPVGKVWYQNSLEVLRTKV